MSAWNKIITCTLLASMIAVSAPRNVQAQFLAFAPQEIATAIKRFMDDVKKSQVIVFATESTGKIKGALGEFNSAMSSFLNNHLLERARDLQRAKCKFDQKKKKLKCSSAVQGYKKVSSKVGEGKELLNRGQQLVNEGKGIMERANQLVADAKASAEKAATGLKVIQEAKEVMTEIQRLSDEANQAKKDYEAMKAKAEDTVNKAKDLKDQADSLISESKSLLERGNSLRKQGQDLISQAVSNPSGAKDLKDEGEAKVKEAEKLIDDAKQMEDKYKALKSNYDIMVDQGKSLGEDAKALKDKVEQIGKDACKLYTNTFSTEATRAASAAKDDDSCNMKDADISGAMKEKIKSVEEDYEKAKEEALLYKQQAEDLYDEADAKVKEGEELLKDAKSFAGSLRNCKAGENPSTDNCYRSEDEEYCKEDPVKDDPEYCDKKYPKKEKKTDTQK